MNLSDAICRRRTYYHLSDETPVAPDKIKELIETALRHTPSAFNMQSARIVLATEKSHHLLWTEIKRVMEQVVPQKQWPDTLAKLKSFGDAYGTVLFFEDETTLSQMRRKYPLYADNFGIWAEQGNAMLQSNVWLLLEEVGFGASLQHYNPVIDECVQKLWNLPHNWRLIAQMPFGTPVEPPMEKTFLPIKSRLWIKSDDNPIEV